MFRLLLRIHVIYFLMGIHFGLTYCAVTLPFLDLDKYVHYGVSLPYQARVLPALIYNAVSYLGLTPPDVHVFNGGLPPRFAGFFLAATLICVLTTLLLFRDILVRHEKFHPLTTSMGSLALLGCLYFNYAIGYEFKFFLPYDLPSIALWTGVLWLAYQKRPVLLILVFTLATLNRETALVLIPCVMAIMLCHHRTSRQAGVMLGLTLLATWCAIKFALHESFLVNAREGNGLAVFSAWKNLRFLLNPSHWPQIMSTWAFLALPFAWSWRRITNPTHRVYKWVVAAMLAILLLTGILIETRIFGELSLLVVLCLAGVVDGAVRRVASEGMVSSAVDVISADAVGSGEAA